MNNNNKSPEILEAMVCVRKWLEPCGQIRLEGIFWYYCNGFV